MSTRSRRPGSKVGPILPLVVSASALLGACGDGATPPDYIAEELEAAKAQLRDHARLRTFEAGKLFGEAWVVRAPDDAELRGLYAYQLVGWGLSKEIHEQADAVLADDPGNPWGIYARAYAHLVDNEAGPAHEMALEAWEASSQPEFAFLYLNALRRDDFQAAWKFLGGLDEETRGWPEMLRMRAELESQARYEMDDPAWADSSRATWAVLNEKFPDHVLGYTRLANEAYQARRMDEWTPLMEAALELAPGSGEVRSQHWRGLWMSDLLPGEERQAAVEASMAAYRAASPETVEGLQTMASMYRQMENEERAAELEARIVQNDPGGYHAMLVYLEETRRASRQRQEMWEAHGDDSPEYRAELPVVRDAAYRYLERPLYSDRFNGGIYLDLYSALQAMDPVPAEELAEAIRGLVKYERLNPHITYGDAPLAMIDHTPYALEAADMVRNGMPIMLERVMETRRFYDTEGEFDQALRSYLSGVYDVIGWAYFKAGRAEDGRHVLERALALADRNRDARYHAGQVYEQLAAEAEEGGDVEAATAWLDRAEDSYIAGFGASRGENPNETALEALYENRNGSREGIEEYLAKNDFDFTVLVDDNYVERAGVSAWPTTWFVDREGYIQFVKIGTALKLDEEFSWRVEALREEISSP